MAASSQRIIVNSRTGYTGAGVSGTRATPTYTAGGTTYTGRTREEAMAAARRAGDSAASPIRPSPSSAGGSQTTTRTTTSSTPMSGSGIVRTPLGASTGQSRSSSPSGLQPSMTPLNQQQIASQNAAIAQQQGISSSYGFNPNFQVGGSEGVFSQGGFQPPSPKPRVAEPTRTQKLMEKAGLLKPTYDETGRVVSYSRGERRSAADIPVPTVAGIPFVLPSASGIGAFSSPIGTGVSATTVSTTQAGRDFTSGARRAFEFAPNLVSKTASVAPAPVANILSSPVGGAIGTAVVGTGIGVATGTTAVYTRKGVEYLGETKEQRQLVKDVGLRSIESRAEDTAREVVKGTPIYKRGLYAVTPQTADINALGLGGATTAYYDSVRQQLMDKGLSGRKLEDAMVLAERRRRANVQASTIGAVTGELAGEFTGGGVLRAAYGAAPVATKFGTNFFKNWASAGWKIGIAGIAEAETQYVSQELAVNKRLNVKDAAISGALGFGTAAVLGGVVVSGAQAAKPIVSKGALWIGRFVDPLESVGDFGASGTRGAYRVLARTTTQEIGTTALNVGGKRAGTVLGTTRVSGFFGKPVGTGFIVPTFSMPASTESPVSVASFAFNPSFAEVGGISVGVTPPSPVSVPSLSPFITPVDTETGKGGGGVVPSFVPEPVDTRGGDTIVNNFVQTSVQPTRTSTFIDTSITSTSTSTSIGNFSPTSVLSAQPYLPPPIPPLLFGADSGGGGRGGRGRKNYLDEFSIAFGALGSLTRGTGRNMFPSVPRVKAPKGKKAKKGKPFPRQQPQQSAFFNFNRAGTDKFNLNTLSSTINKRINKAMK